jgi:hypothetical protein
MANEIAGCGVGTAGAWALSSATTEAVAVNARITDGTIRRIELSYLSDDMSKKRIIEFYYAPAPPDNRIRR